MTRTEWGYKIGAANWALSTYPSKDTAEEYQRLLMIGRLLNYTENFEYSWRWAEGHLKKANER